MTSPNKTIYFYSYNEGDGIYYRFFRFSYESQTLIWDKEDLTSKEAVMKYPSSEYVWILLAD